MPNEAPRLLLNWNGSLQLATPKCLLFYGRTVYLLVVVDPVRVLLWPLLVFLPFAVHGPHHSPWIMFHWNASKCATTVSTSVLGSIWRTTRGIGSVRNSLGVRGRSPPIYSSIRCWRSSFCSIDWMEKPKSQTDEMRVGRWRVWGSGMILVDLAECEKGCAIEFQSRVYLSVLRGSFIIGMN